VQINTVIEQLWSWLSSTGKTEHKILVNGVVETVGLSRQQVERAAHNLIGPVVDEIITRHDWDFACDVVTDDTTVVNQSEYTFTGNSNDCRDIINIRYGDGRGVVLDELNTLKTDRREEETVSGAADTSGVYGYTLFGRSPDGFPKVQLFDTPTEAKTLKYRYRKKDLNIGNIPDSFGFVVRDFMRAEFDPGFQAKAENRLAGMIDRYKVGGDTPDVARLDPQIESGNIRRKANQGGC